MSGPLSGLRIVEFAGIGPGPFCGMMLAFGMLAAIWHAQKTGQGQVVDCAMSEGSAVLMAMIYSLYGQNRWADERGANLIDSGAHFYNTYETADGKYISLGAIEPQFYKELLERIGLANGDAFQDQNDPSKWPLLRERLDRHFRTKTREEWTALLEKTNTCFAPVLSLSEAALHPHNQARGSFIEVDGTIHPAPAPRYLQTANTALELMKSGTETTNDLLQGLGYSDGQITDLRDRNVVL